MSQRSARQPNQKISQHEEHFRDRCDDCFRPVRQCYCDAITPVGTRTEFLILQHRRERVHPFNSARIAARALTNCKLVCDRNEQLAQMNLPIKPSAGLLYPTADARLLDQVPPEDLPEQSVVIDGTWHQAKTLYRDVEVLRTLPCFALAPSSPGQYQIRLEPDASSLSTVEAIAAAIKQMEPNNADVERLLDGFYSMIEKQLAHPKANYSGQTVQSKRAANLNVPKSLLSQEHSLVVFYCEATPLHFTSSEQWADVKQKRRAVPLPPVYLCAQRIHLRDGSVGDSASDQFVRKIQSQEPLTTTGLRHMGLEMEDFQDALSLEEFRHQWHNFLRADDRLVAFHRSSIGLLQNADASVPLYDLLQGINYDPNREFGAISDYLKSFNQRIASPICKGRGGRRLASAVALVRHLFEISGVA
jgi:DTW domain-containing protein YfiP